MGLSRKKRSATLDDAALQAADPRYDLILAGQNDREVAESIGKSRIHD